MAALLLMVIPGLTTQVVPAFAEAAPGLTSLVMIPGQPSAGCAGVVGASQDARYLLVLGCRADVFRLDRITGTLLPASVDAEGHDIPAAGDSYGQAISSDGTTVTYISKARQVIKSDLISRQLSVVSASSAGEIANVGVTGTALSSNGRWLLFASGASNLVPGVAPGGPNSYGDASTNLYRKDLQTGAVSLAVPTVGPSTDSSFPGGISDDGNRIAFDSIATNIVGSSLAGVPGTAYLRDLTTGGVTRLTYQKPDSMPTRGSRNSRISADGHTAIFIGVDSAAENDVVSCTVPDILSVSCQPKAHGYPVFDPHLSADGSAVEYAAGNTTSSTNLQVFRLSIPDGTAGVASVNNFGEVANSATGNVAGGAGISGDGLITFFLSGATNLDPMSSSTGFRNYLHGGSGSSSSPGTFNGVAPQSGKPGTEFQVTYSCRFSPSVTVMNDVATAQANSDIKIALPISEGDVYHQSVVIGREGDYTVTAACGGQQLGAARLHVVQTLTYAALGDSYSSGEGAIDADGSTPYYIPPSDGTGNACHRATTAWPIKIRNGTGSTIDFAACSGAKINDFNAFKYQEAPQRDHISPNVTKIASLSVGGNDIGFADIASACIATLRGCSARDTDAGKDQDPSTTTVKTALTWLTAGRPIPPGAIENCVWMPGIDPATIGLKPKPEQTCYDHSVPSLHALYEDLISRLAPGAKLVITGYPTIFGDDQRYRNASRGACLVGELGGVALTVSGKDISWLNNTLVPSLNKTILSEVRIAKAWAALPNVRPDVVVRFAPDDGAFDGHRLCDSGPSFINRVLFTGSELRPESLHPNQVGQAAIAEYILPAFR